MEQLRARMAKMKIRWWHCVLGAGVLLLALFAAGGAYLWSVRNSLLDEQIRAVLTAAGVEAFELELAEVGWSGTRIRSLRIGEAAAPDLEAENIAVDYELAGLLDGRLGTVRVGAVRLRATAGADGLHLGQLAPLMSGTGGGAFPVGNLAIDAVHALLNLPQGVVEVGGGLLIEPEGASGLLIRPAGGCLHIATGTLDVGAALVDPLSADVCLSNGRDALSWPLKEPLSLGTGTVPLVLRGDQGRVLLDARLASLSATVNGAELAGARLRAEGGRFALPGFDLALSDAVLALSMEESGSMAGAWTLEGGRVEDLQPVIRFAPVRIAGEGTLSPVRVAFDLIASDPKSLTPLFSVAGAHEIAAGQGEARAMLGPLVFRGGGLQPQRLLPVFKGLMANVVGSAGGEGRFRWAPGRLSSDGTLELDGVGLSTEAARIEGVTGKVAFRRLLPPVTAPAQSLAVGLVDAGFQLTDGRVAFAVTESGAVQVERASWPFAGGSISLSSGLIEPGAVEQQLELDVDKVDLASFIELLNFPGATGTGIVSGRVPVTIRDGNVIIADARLTTSGPGRLSYKGQGADALGGGQGALVFQALEDFRYTDLTLLLDGNAQDRLSVKLKLEGANPELYDGYPFAININTEASFAELLRSATVGTRALDLIRENGAARQ